MPKQKMTFNLKTKLMITFLLISICPVILIAALSYQKTEFYIKKNLVSALKGISEIKYQAIKSFMEDRMDQVERASEALYVIENLSAISDMTQRRAAVEYVKLRENLDSLLGKSEKFAEVYVMDPAGIVVASTNQDYEGKTAKNLEYFIHGKEKTYLQNVFVSPITDKATMVIATPIKKDDGTLIGVLASRLNLDALYAVIRDYTGLGETGETVVADLRDNEAVVLHPTRHDEKAALEKKIRLGPESGKPLQESVQGKSGEGLVKDYRGQDVIAVWRHVPTTGWGMVTKIDAREIAQPQKDLKNYIVLLSVLIVIIVFLLASILALSIVRPIDDLTEAADRISKGDLSVQIIVKSHDEIGRLAESFERMLAAIKFFKEDKG